MSAFTEMSVKDLRAELAFWREELELDIKYVSVGVSSNSLSFDQENIAAIEAELKRRGEMP